MSRIQIVNNGTRLANDMHFHDFLKDGMTTDECYIVALSWGLDYRERKFLDQDDFWEDFCYRAEELGYKLKL